VQYKFYTYETLMLKSIVEVQGEIKFYEKIVILPNFGTLYVW